MSARSALKHAGQVELEAEPAGLLVVDDEPPILTAVQRTLRGQPYVVHVAEGGVEALEILARERIGVVVSDQRMSGMDGVQLLREVKERYPTIQRIMMTAHVDFPTLQASVNLSEIFRFVQKPWDSAQLITTIGSAFDQYSIVRDNQRLWALTEHKNEQLRVLNHDLEARIERRTVQLARAKVEWESTFDAIVDPVAIVDAHHAVVRANVAYAATAGLSVREVSGHRCHMVIAGRDAPCVGCPLPQALSGRPSGLVDIGTQDGRTLEVTAYPLAVVEKSRGEERPLRELESGDVALERAVCCYRDVTEARALSAELDRTRRLASLGLFVGGVAHEINNPLGSVLAFTQILLDAPVAADAEVSETLREIEGSAIRAKRIIESLQSFAQGSQLRHAAVDVSALINDVVRAFSRDYGATPIQVEIAPGLPQIYGDALLLHQLLRNLLQNGEQAMAGADGVLRVRAEPGGVAGDVVLEVADEGAGIDEGLLARIYDPFYTTKQSKGGTGLGLSICHRIVEQHGGTIEVRSRVGEGTAFRVTLHGVSHEIRGPE